MTLDAYPSVSIVAGEVKHFVGVTSHLLRMNDSGIYIAITPAIAKQWIPVLQTITEAEDIN